MRNSLLIIATILILTSIAFGNLLKTVPQNLVFAENSPLEITWDDPLFDYDNLAPGDPIATKEVTIKNTSADTQFDVYFGAVDTSFKEGDGGGLLHDELDVTLTDLGGTTIYCSNTLAELFKIARDNGCTSIADMSSNENCAKDLGILLGPGDETTVEMSVSFDQSVGNDYQGSRVVFDLLTGFLGAGAISGVSTGPTGLLGLATGANLIYSVLGSLTSLAAGLYLRRRQFSKKAS